jgi:hypothetical protein
MLKIRNLDAGYGKLRVLKNISLHVNGGEIVTMIGANGAGKTTLLHTIIGLIKPTKGEIRFHGAILHPDPGRADSRLRLRSGSRGSAGVRADVGGGEPAARRLCPAKRAGQGGGAQGTGSISTNCFPSCANGGGNWPAPFPAVNSRCWPWVGP